MAWKRDPDRPMLLGLVFWLVLGATAVINLVVPSTVLERILFFADVVLLCVLWPMMPWQPGRGRHLVAPAFLAGALALGLTGSAGTHFPLLLIGVANLAFVYGMRIASAILVAFGAVLIVVPLFYGRTIVDALGQTAVIAVMSVFAMGMASAVLKARQLTDRVRELTVAEERGRMAAEMHDSIGHHLTVIKVGLENAERFRDRRPEAAWEEVRQAKELTTAALADARRWVRALRPLPLNGNLGSAALQRLADSFTGTGVTVTFQVSGTERELEPDAELVLYRVLQEGLTNVLRHAEAGSVRGTLTFEKGKVVLVIADDGKGRDHDQGHGFGLSTLADRVRALGGTLTSGNAAKGFELRAELPS
ncbi:sensor histidine kinase [Nonomuraea jiangxiensis]|uniref:histidine kinase n=1 Tax=Nonomuraea jiangxiensis TaxID=633440 RepID=A0A1G8JQK8_9ACTN|nr:sensor histidine kinase [Nonomuraea jiangxiensis]SDI33475.1 Signal transduction histidine kinase [Nonomuraea jiangxiensis]